MEITDAPPPAPRRWPALALATVLGVVAAASFASFRARSLAADETTERLAATSFARLLAHPESSELSAHLLRAGVAGPRRVDVTVCLDRADRAWRDRELDGAFDVVLWEPTRQALAARSRAASSRAQIEGGVACVPMIDGRIAGPGSYSLDLAWPGRAPDSRLTASRIAAVLVTWRALAAIDALAVALLGLAVVVAGVTWALAAPRASGAAAAMPVARGLIASVLGVVVLMAASSLASGWLRPMVSAIANVAVVAVVVTMASPGRRLESLGLERPRSWVWVVAPFAGLAIGLASQWLTRWLPGTGQSVVERAIAMPSGRVATASLALLAPIGEELVFRGAAFAAIRRYGAAAAIVASTTLFALAHLPQLEGAIGAALGIAVAGLGFAVIRASMRSVWASLVAHFSYNAVLVALGIWSELAANR